MKKDERKLIEALMEKIYSEGWCNGCGCCGDESLGEAEEVAAVQGMLDKGKK